MARLRSVVKFACVRGGATRTLAIGNQRSPCVLARQIVAKNICDHLSIQDYDANAREHIVGQSVTFLPSASGFQEKLC